MLLPLSFVIFISAVKDIIEDVKRQKSDKQENFQLVTLVDSNMEESGKVKCEDLRVG